jgi:LysM domain
MTPTMRPWRRSALLVGWVVLLVAALGLFHALGRGAFTAPPLARPGALASWLDEQSTTTLAFGALRLAAMGLAWYLLAATIAGLLAHFLGSARWSATVDAISPAVVRRVVRGAAGVTMAASVTGAQAAAWAAPPGQPSTASPVPIMRRLPPDPPATTAPPPTTPPPTSPAPANPMPPTALPPSTPPPTWVIRPGDNLWSVAEATLAGAWGRRPSDAEIDGYWMTLIAANRPRLAHGDDPDLVFPGQVFVLPALPAPGHA